MEQKRGFIHDMLDVKVLVLYAVAQLQVPVEFQTLLEVCIQDDGIGYFDLREAVSQLSRSGHLTESEAGVISLTDTGREHGALTEDSLALPLRKKVCAAVDAWNSHRIRESRIGTDITEADDGAYLVSLRLDSPVGLLMHLELSAPSLKQARYLRSAMFEKAEELYTQSLDILLENEEEAT